MDAGVRLGSRAAVGVTAQTVAYPNDKLLSGKSVRQAHRQARSERKTPHAHVGFSGGAVAGCPAHTPLRLVAQ